MDQTTLILSGLRPIRLQRAFQSTHRGIKLQRLKETGYCRITWSSSERTKILIKKRKPLIKLSPLHLFSCPLSVIYF